jgi:hypothetical protein
MSTRRTKACKTGVHSLQVSAHTAVSRGVHSLVRLVRVLLPLGVVSVACGARTGLSADEVAPVDAGREAELDPPRDARVEAPVAIVDAGRDTGPSLLCTPFDAGSGADAGTCSRSVRVTRVTRSTSTCFVDLAFDVGEIGTLRFACGGGAAEMVFSRGTFRGGYDGQSVDVCAGTTFKWSDGCSWDSAQRALGELGSGELSFTYVEQTTAGSGCSSPCTATGTVEVL